MALEDLQQSITNLDAQIVAVTANPQPNYSSGDESYSWADYLKMLIEQRKALMELVQSVDDPVWATSESVV
jgi:hypothetical protein